MQPYSERRRFPRISMLDDAYLVMGSEGQTICRIKDVGMGGARVEPLAEESDLDGWTTAEIFLSVRQFHLEDIACRRVYRDRAPSLEGPFAFVRRDVCGVEFGSLSQEQEASLAKFIAWQEERSNGVPRKRSCQ